MHRLELGDRALQQLGQQFGVDRAHGRTVGDLDFAGLRFHLSGIDQKLEGVVPNLEIVGVAGNQRTWQVAGRCQIRGRVKRSALRVHGLPVASWRDGLSGPLCKCRTMRQLDAKQLIQNADFRERAVWDRVRVRTM